MYFMFFFISSLNVLQKYVRPSMNVKHQILYSHQLFGANKLIMESVFEKIVSNDRFLDSTFGNDL